MVDAALVAVDAMLWSMPCWRCHSRCCVICVNHQCATTRHSYPIQIGGGVVDSVLDLQFDLDGVLGSIA
jgi:hypothetical protein